MTKQVRLRGLVTALTVVCVLLMSGMMGSPMAAAATGDGSASDANILYVGRWDKTDASVYRSYWPGAYFRVNFTGTTVQLRLAGAANLYVSIDGRGDVYYPGASGTINLTPAPLAAGVHTLRVASRSESDVLQFQGLILSSGATTQAPAVRSKRLEFIGDSITAGCCALSQGALHDYAWLVGEALNADHTQIAYSGICLQDGVACFAPNNIGMSNQYFKLQTVQYPSSPMWDFTRYQADAVVINLGTNDNTRGISDAALQSTYTTFLQNVRAQHPNAVIFALRTFGGFKVAPTLAAVNARISAGDTKLYYVDTSGWVTPGTSDFSDDLHPSESGHVKIAKLLAPFIAKTARWEAPFSDDFNDGNANGWSVYGGSWAVSGNQLTVAAHPGAKAIPVGVLFSNGTLDADITIGTAGNAGLMFRASRLETGTDAYQGYFAGFEQGQVFLGKADNNWTTIASAAAALAANTAHHVRVVAVGSTLRVYVDDMVTPRITVTDTSYASGTIGVRTYQAAARFDNVTARAFSRFEASLRGYFLRHQNGRGRIDQFLSPAEDAEWRIVPGLANASALSLESVAFPGYFLRHANGELWLAQNDGSALFKADATWWRRPGQANASLSSFESFNFPGSYIRHRNSLLYSEPLSTDLDRSDATFRE
ncbi:AbfB domain-containing protein [Stigmatella aurantiaca]|uniref:Esterase, SGNH hydrolase-type n=1 Tax=Stigmatella aurantiaca (strain DW4/3-1) TaxID=378806 RepID=Q08RB4_STIAD|nr:AbfB domain-containing protein [Stigmatella aurantiaca]ADO71607.1 Esterase, SGNH hydrolase-type [Stigmatella aurantiaca DW4/3-1]EAU63023.1 putative alpha-arabinofuranosidase II [Stigmatella aurantiaca DW4/3-1]